MPASAVVVPAAALAVMLMTAAPAEAIRAVGPISLLMEDHFEAGVNGEHYAYGELEVTEGELAGQIIHLDVAVDGSANFTSNDIVELDVAAVTYVPPRPGLDNGPDHPGSAGTLPGAAPPTRNRNLAVTPYLVSSGMTLYAVNEVVSVTPATTAPTAAPAGSPPRRSRSRRNGLMKGERSIVLVRLAFDDVEPACDEACVLDMMWGTSGSTHHINGVYSEASAGQLTFTQPPRVYTVHLPGNANAKSCVATALANEADLLLASEHGVQATGYTHRSYIMPPEISGCSWSGLAHVGCTASFCRSWLRTTPAMGGTVTLAHELGHNLGLWHAGTDVGDDGGEDTSYGDKSCFMGSDYAWRSLNAPHRRDLGWLQESAIQELPRVCTGGTGTTVLLSSLSLPDTALATDEIKVVRFTRSAYGGGEYILSLRTAVGYDATMPPSFLNQLSVHYVSPNLPNSQLVATVAPGETRVIPSADVTITLGPLNGVGGARTTLDVNFCDGNGELTTMPPPTASPTDAASLLPCAEHTVDGAVGHHIELEGRVGVNSAVNGFYTYAFRFGGRSGYQHATSSMMMYWLAAHSVWAVGSDLGSTVINAYLSEDVVHPHLHTASFKVLASGQFITDPDVKCDCIHVAATTAASTLATSTEEPSTEHPTQHPVTTSTGGPLFTSTAEPRTVTESGTIDNNNNDPLASSSGETPASTADKDDGIDSFEAFCLALAVILGGLIMVLGVMLFPKAPQDSGYEKQEQYVPASEIVRAVRRLTPTRDGDGDDGIAVDRIPGKGPGRSRPLSFPPPRRLSRPDFAEPRGSPPSQKLPALRSAPLPGAESKTTNPLSNLRESQLVDANFRSSRASITSEMLGLREYMPTFASPVPEAAEQTEYLDSTGASSEYLASVATASAENSPDKPLADDDDIYRLAQQAEPVYKVAQPEHDMYAAATPAPVVPANSPAQSLAVAKAAAKKKKPRSSVGFALPDVVEEDSKGCKPSEGAAPIGIARNNKNRGKSMKDMGLPPPAFQRPPSFGLDDDSTYDSTLPAPSSARSVGFSLPDMDEEDSKEYMASGDASIPPTRRSSAALLASHGKSIRERGIAPPSFEQPPSFAEYDDDDDGSQPREYLVSVPEGCVSAFDVPPTRRGTAAPPGQSVGFALSGMDDDVSKEYMLSEGDAAVSTSSSPPPVPSKVGLRRDRKNHGKSMKDMGLPPPAFERPPSFGDVFVGLALKCSSPGGGGGGYAPKS
jgi:hypothetical protein